MTTDIELTPEEERRVREERYLAEVAATWFNRTIDPSRHDPVLEARAVAFMRAYQEFIHALQPSGLSPRVTAPLMVAVIGQSQATVELIDGLMKYTRPFREHEERVVALQREGQELPEDEDWVETYLEGGGQAFDDSLFRGKYR